MREIVVVGVDCAVDPAKVGVTIGSASEQGFRLTSAQKCSKACRPVRLIAKSLAGVQDALVGLDAPLGWPESLGSNLKEHRAGCSLADEPNQLFRRETDRFIKQEIGKQSLDVGADRIARTAAAALALLDSLRSEVTAAITLAWQQQEVTGIQAIEVYPAATLLARGIKPVGYKGSDGVQARRDIVDKLKNEVDFRCDVQPLIDNADVLDAAICALASYDFLKGMCFEPAKSEVAKKEGWIWVRRPHEEKSV